MGTQKKESSWLGDAWDLMTNNTLGAAGGAAADYAQTPAGGAYGNGAMASEISALGKVAGGGLSVLGLAGGAQQFFGGIDKIQSGDSAEGGLDLAAGYGSAMSGIVGMMGLAPQGTAMYSAATAGLGTAGMGTSVAAAGAAPVAAAIGAGAAGGITLGMSANDFMSERGWLGSNVDSSNRDFSDLAADAGTSVHDTALDWGLGETAALWAGGAATVGSSILETPFAAAAGAAEIGGDVLDFAGDTASAAWGAMFD